jgi:transcriptional regulator with XRE-family HTH domain
MLSELLLLYRSVHRLSLRELAAEIGVSHGTLHRVENGKPIEGETMLKLMNWLFTTEKRTKGNDNGCS